MRKSFPVMTAKEAQRIRASKLDDVENATRAAERRAREATSNAPRSRTTAVMSPSVGLAKQAFDMIKTLGPEGLAQRLSLQEMAVLIEKLGVVA